MEDSTETPASPPRGASPKHCAQQGLEAAFRDAGWRLIGVWGVEGLGDWGIGEVWTIVSKLGPGPERQVPGEMGGRVTFYKV